MKPLSGDTIKIKVHWILYKYLGEKNPKQGCDIRVVKVVSSAKGTDYQGSDWIVCKPEYYALPNRAKYEYGIGNEQILKP